MRDRLLKIAALMLAAATIVAATPSAAAFYGPGPGYYGPGPRGPAFGGPRPFGPAWTGGRWTYGWHGPRYGWWWTVGNAWYLYPRPIYPYPTDLPPVAYDDYGSGDYGSRYQPDYRQSGSTQQQQQLEERAQLFQYWYYCDNPRGYYPYLQDCANWREVPAEPYAPPPRDGSPPPNYPDPRDQQ